MPFFLVSFPFLRLSSSISVLSPYVRRKLGDEVLSKCLEMNGSYCNGEKGIVKIRAPKQTKNPLTAVKLDEVSLHLFVRE